jgi:hypothetical protein
MVVPIIAIFSAALGLLVCLFLYWRFREPIPRALGAAGIRPSDLNKEIDLDRYQSTSNPILFLDKAIEEHPFKIGDGGVFCQVCLINTQLKPQTGPVLIHSQDCTAIRKEWRIAICRDAGMVEYFISQGKAHFRKR